MSDQQDDPPAYTYPGPDWFKTWAEDMRQWMIEHRPVAGLNCTLVDTPGGGKRIDVGLVPAILLQPFPFQVSIVNGKYRVNPGTINNLIPSGLSTYQKYEEGDMAILDVTTDGDKVIRAAVVTSSDAPEVPDCVMSSGPINFKVPIAILQATGVEQIWFTNMAAIKTQCNQTEKSYPITPTGSSPWINWFTWTVVPELTPQLFPV